MNILQYEVLSGGLEPFVRGQKQLFLRFPYRDETIPPLTNWTVPLRVCVKLPEGFSACIENTKSLLLNHDIYCPSIFVSSSDMSELQCKLMNNGAEPYTIHRGDPIVQLVIFKTDSAMEIKGVDKVE